MVQPRPPATRRLDTRGSFCPLPVIQTDAAMRQLAPGEVLEVLADDIGVKLDLPAWCKANRQRLLDLSEETAAGRRIWRVTIMKMGECA